MDDLQKFDACLRNKKFFDEVVEFFRQKGGPNVRFHVFNILNTTISNCVATQYSYKGQKKKRKFMDLMFNTCIHNAVQMHIPSATEDNIKLVVSVWLSNSTIKLKNKQNKRVTIAHLRLDFESSIEDEQT